MVHHHTSTSLLAAFASITTGTTMSHPSQAPARERARLVIILTTIAISIAGVILFSLVPWSDWRTGLLLNIIENTILIGFCIGLRDRLIPHLMLFGFVVGGVEPGPARTYR